MSDLKPTKLAVFDVEGVLVPKYRYLLFEVGRKLDFSALIRIFYYGLLYEAGLIPLEVALRNLVKVLKGFSVDELLEIFRHVPLLPGAEETLRELKNRGWKIALISSGLPDFVVKDLAGRLGADYGYGFKLEVSAGSVTGEVSGEVIEPEGKRHVLEGLLRAFRLNPENCIIVADDRNNVSMMLPEAVKIGYNPDFIVRIKADYVICGRLNKLIDLVDSGIGGVFPTKNEFTRELLHACGFTVPLLAHFLGASAMASLILAVSVLYAFSEIAKLEDKRFPIISWITRHAAAENELYGFATAPIYYAAGIMLTLLIFPSSISSVAIAAFAMGDSAATIAGKIIGRNRLPFNKGKTIEGLLFGLTAGFFAALIYADMTRALIAALAASIVESLPLPVNDNLSIPIITAAALALVG